MTRMSDHKAIRFDDKEERAIGNLITSLLEKADYKEK